MPVTKRTLLVAVGGVIVLALVVLILFGPGISTPSQAWRFTTSSGGETHQLVGTAPRFETRQHWVLKPPTPEVSGQFNQELLQGTYEIVLSGTPDIQSDLSVSFGDRAIVAECSKGRVDEKAIRGATVSARPTNNGCAFRIELRETLKNPGGNEIGWQLRPLDGTAEVSIEFAATREA